MNPLKENLEALLRVADTKKQIDEFVQAFKFAVDTLTKMKGATTAELSQLRITFDQAIQDIKNFNLQELVAAKTDLLQQIQTTLTEQQKTLGSALKDQQDGLNYMRDWVRNLPIARNGKDANEQQVVQAVLAKLPPVVIPAPYDDNEVQTRIEELTKELEALKAAPKGQTPGWGAHPLAIQQSGSTKVKLARTINFTGATVTHSTQGITTVAITGGGGFTELAATETPNGSTTIFTFSTASAQPSYVVSDNVWMKATSKAGTVNWTWSAGAKQATLTIPPTDDIFAIV